MPRIYELGGEIHRDIKDFCKDSACPDAYLPSKHGDMKALLNVLVEAERCAMRVYTDICQMTHGKDPRTYELAAAILHEETEHEAWFSEFLGEKPSGHFRRGTPGESPYVSRFLVVPR